MADADTGYKWWVRYVLVPLIGGGGLIAVIVAYINRPREATPINQLSSASAPAPVAPAGSHTGNPEGPHAAYLPSDYGKIIDSKAILVVLKPGGERRLEVRDIWTAPAGAEASCINALMVFTWSVRRPFPDGRSGLEVRHLIPQNGGRTELLSGGAEGVGVVGYCDELILINNGLEEYSVELRYGSVMSSE